MTQRKRPRNLRRNRIRSLNPIHPHCGPFNDVSSSASSSEVDEACRRHDIRYGQMQSRYDSLTPYVTNNDADEKFIEEMDQQSGILPRLYSGVFKLKRMLPLPNLTTSSFGKMPGYRKRKFASKKRGNGKRSKRLRKKAKAIKRVTRLQILKAVGSKFELTRSRMLNMRHTIGLASNRIRMFGLVAFGDRLDYDKMMKSQYGPAAHWGDPVYNAGVISSKGVEPNYVLKNYAKVQISNVANTDVKCRLVRFKFTRDFYSTIPDGDVVNGSIDTLFEFIRDTQAPGYLSAAQATDIVVTGGSTFGEQGTTDNQPPRLSWTDGVSLPFGGKKDKGFTVKFGKQWIMEPGKSVYLNLKGRKGYIPTMKMGLWIEDPLPLTLGSHQTPTITPHTVIYCLIVQNATHSVSTVATDTNRREAYIDGSYRIVADVTQKSVLLGNHSSQNPGVWGFYEDSRPNIGAVGDELVAIDVDEDLENPNE